MDKFEVQNWLEELLKAGELDRAVLHLEEKLLELPDSPFHEILRLKFTNKFLSVLPDLRQLNCDDF